MVKVAVGTILVASLALVIYFPDSQYSSAAFALAFLLCGIGLGHEAISIRKTGVVKARIYRSTKDLVILKTSSPVRFGFYLVSYTILSLFCLMVGIYGSAHLLA